MDEDLIRIKELLRRTGEFIAYFELVEEKMRAWRHDIEDKTQHLLSQAQRIEQHLLNFETNFSEIGISEFQLSAENALAQGESHLIKLEANCLQFTEDFEHQHAALKQVTADAVATIEKHALRAVDSISQHLGKYDVEHFHRIASESSDYVAQVSTNAISQSKKIVSGFQLRLVFFSLVTTFLTAFMLVLYLSDEYPWEMHYKAFREREAGRVLLRVWPVLSQIEKDKILNGKLTQDG